MTSEPKLDIKVDLFGALAEVLAAEPVKPTPIVVLSAYLYRLAQGYGLSESQHLTESQLERVDLPEPAAALIRHYLGNVIEPDDGDHLRDRLYKVFLHLSRDGNARKILNRTEPLSEVGLLKVAQIFWNVEATASRPSLPLKPGNINSGSGTTVHTDIKAPDSDKDFATMKWTA